MQLPGLTMGSASREGGVPGGLQEQEVALAEPSWPWPSWHNVVAGRGERGGVCLEQAQEPCAGCRGRLHVQERMGFRKEGI